MQKWLQKIVLFIAVVTVTGHNFLSHDHHEEIDAVAHHDHDANDEDHNNLFSFAQLDEDFIAGKFQIASIEPLFIFLPVFYQSLPMIERRNSNFHYYREFPPPRIYLSALPLRAPPMV
jgi:hypothetical protein